MIRDRFSMYIVYLFTCNIGAGSSPLDRAEVMVNRCDDDTHRNVTWILPVSNAICGDVIGK